MSYLPLLEYGQITTRLLILSIILGLVPSTLALFSFSPASEIFLLGSLLVLTVEAGVILGFHANPFLQQYADGSTNSITRSTVSYAIGSVTAWRVTRFVIGFLVALPFVIGIHTANTAVVGAWTLLGGILGGIPNYRTPTEQESGDNTDPDGVNDRKNVILYMCDDIRRDRMSLYGYDRDTTPFLESLAEDSLVFTNHVSAGTRSGTSIPSLLTGVPASVHEYGHNTELQTIMQEFADAGYHTAGINTNGHLPPDSWGKFFDYYLYLPSTYDLSVPVVNLFTNVMDRLGISYRSNRDLNTADTATMNSMAKEYITNKEKQEQPYFLFVGSIEAHAPYIRDPDAVAAFASEHGVELDVSANLDKDRSRRRAEWHSDALKQWGYDEMVHYTDRQLQDLIQFLQTEGYDEHTTVMVVSDHGELLGEFDMWGHLDMFVNPLFEVPLVILDPDLGSGDIPNIVSGLDVPPLLLDIAEVNPSKNFTNQMFRETKFEDLSSNNGSTALIDSYGPNLSTKNYSYHSDELNRPDIAEQRMMLNTEQKLLWVDNDIFQFKYEDGLLERPQRPDERSESLQMILRQSLDWIEQARRANQIENAYDDIESTEVLEQLESMGYLER